jgi:dynamin 1-like protein
MGEQNHSHGYSTTGTGAQQGIVPVGRDVSGTDNTTTNNLVMSSGLTGTGLRGDRYGSSAAYDMKSLGKHIEAVSCFFLF